MVPRQAHNLKVLVQIQAPQPKNQEFPIKLLKYPESLLKY